MPGLQCEEVMTWSVDDVVKWIQMNNLGNFRPFISRECINGQSLLQLDKKRLENCAEAKKSEKEALLKLLKNIGKEKDPKKQPKLKSLLKGKGANGSAAVPTSVQPPSIRPPPPPTVEDEEFEDVYDPDEWDDDRGIYDNDDDAQPPKPAINPQVHSPADVDDDSENESEYVNPDEDYEHANDESHNVQESYYEEDTISIQRASGGRGPAPMPPSQDEELYEDPDHAVTAPSLPPIPAAPSKARNARLPPPIPSDDFYEPADPPKKVPQPKHPNYESAAIARMPSASKSRGVVPPAPTLEELPDKPPDRPPPRAANRRPVPPPCVPVPDDDHGEPVLSRPLPPVVKRSVPVPSPPASMLLHQSPSQEIYEEADELQEKILPPSRRGSQGSVRPPPPKPTSQDDSIYEPASDEALESPPSPPAKPPNRRAPAPLPAERGFGEEVYEPTDIPDPWRDDDDVPGRSNPAAPQPSRAKVPGPNTGNFGVSSIALRDIKGNLKKAIPTFNTENSSANEVKGKFSEATQRVHPQPSDAPKKLPPPTPAKQRSADPPRERAPPVAPPAQETASHSSTASRSTVTDPNDVSTQPWFFGDLPSNEATALLKKLNTDGTYLVRESKRSGHPYTLVLSFREDIFNIPIRNRLDGKYALGSEKAHEHVFETVNDMVRFHRNNTIEVSKDGKPVGKVKLAKIADK